MVEAVGCDDCPISLNNELNDFNLLVDVLNDTLGNLSSVALTGAHLYRTQKAANELNVS